MDSVESPSRWSARGMFETSRHEGGPYAKLIGY